ncbi:MAG: hypothetical protein ABGZ53_18195 [Fuerstiella sp.]
MKNLLRMSLFIIARAGLCLAVVAWIAGQWWGGVSFSVPIGQRPVVLLDGTRWTLNDGMPFSYFPYLDHRGAEVAEWQWSGFGNAPPSNHPFYGIVYAKEYGSRYLSVDHWLIISFFTAFNIALHCIYRRRPEGKPCEV